jgi:predicted Zn-dependent protease
MSDMKIEDLTVQDLHRLRAAEGWIELGDCVSACDELEEITAEARANPLVLSMRLAIYTKAGKWDLVSEVANALTVMLPDEPETWITLAYATRQKRGGSIAEAKRILLMGQVKFPREYFFPFKLACYCAQLDELEEAAEWLKRAMAIDEDTVRKLAVDNADLKSLWESMGGTIWEKE